MSKLQTKPDVKQGRGLWEFGAQVIANRQPNWPTGREGDNGRAWDEGGRPASESSKAVGHDSKLDGSLTAARQMKTGPS
jgi:hypothetical protein